MAGTVIELNVSTGQRTSRPYTAEEQTAVDVAKAAELAAASDPNNFPLTMRQLRLALLTFGSKPVDFVASVINNVADPVEKAKATIWYEETTDGISWGHPETQFLIAASGLTSDQAKALWLKAKDL